MPPTWVPPARPLPQGDNTALHWAAMRGHVEISRILLKTYVSRGAGEGKEESRPRKHEQRGRGMGRAWDEHVFGNLPRGLCRMHPSCCQDGFARNCYVSVRF